jgi:hypothetical protein
MRSIMRRVVVVATAVALLLGGGTAFAETLPANLGNSGDSDRGASGQGNEEVPALGPHVHCVLPAVGNGSFEILVPVSHQAHVTTGNGVIFVANSCP